MSRSCGLGGDAPLHDAAGPASLGGVAAATRRRVRLWGGPSHRAKSAFTQSNIQGWCRRRSRPWAFSRLGFLVPVSCMVVRSRKPQYPTESRPSIGAGPGMSLVSSPTPGVEATESDKPRVPRAPVRLPTRPARSRPGRIGRRGPWPFRRPDRLAATGRGVLTSFRPPCPALHARSRSRPGDRAPRM